MSAANFILSLARKLLARESKGITTIPNRMAAEQKAAEIVVKLENAGLPLNRANEFIRSEQDLIRILNMIENTPPVMREVPSGIRSTESAKVFDIKGKEIKDTKNIIGGEEVKETEGAIKSRLEKGNKESAQRIRMKKMVDDAIDNMSPSLSGDMRTDAVLVAEDLAERMGMVYDDLPIREQTKLYDQAYQGLSNMRFEARQTPKGAPPKITSKKDADSQESSYDDGPADFDPDADNETFATGGRAGFKSGLGFKFLKFLNENNPVQAYKKYLQSVKTRAQENPKKLAPELAAVASGGIFVNRRMQDILKNMKEKDMENNLENFKEELNKDPFYQKYPKLKDKTIEAYTEKMFGEKRADGGRAGFKLGGIDKARRAFLKAAAGITGGIAALKTGLLNIGKGADTVKNLPPIKTPVTKLEGTTTEMPDWFPSFINKFRDEGKAKDVFKTKKVEVSKAEYDQAFKEGKGENYFSDVARTPEYKANNPDHILPY